MNLSSLDNDGYANMSSVCGRVSCLITTKLWRFGNIVAPTPKRGVYLTGLSLRKGGAKLGSDEARRLPGLKSNEKRIAVFAGVSVVVGYVSLKLAFSSMAANRPPTTDAGLTPVRPIVIAGPSGSGKSTLLRRLFAEFPNQFGFSVSHTTRNPRSGETNGKEYHFTNKENMKKAVDNGEFIEWAEFSGNMYGTSKKAITDVLKSGKVCVLDIDMQGVRSMKSTNYNPLYIFVKPPSMNELERRLRERKTETEESLQRRLQTAVTEMEYADTPDVFDFVVVNSDVEEAYGQLKEFIVKELLTGRDE